MQRSGFLTEPALTRYAGVQPGPMLQVIPTGCSGLAFAASGSSALGASLQFVLTNFGNDIPGIAFGGPAPTPIAPCANCALGLRLDAAIVPTLLAPTFDLDIPRPWLVDLTSAMQGFSIGAGSGLGSFRFSDTIQFTIR